ESSYYQDTENCLPLGATPEALDLLQQCRMAVATEDMNFWTKMGVLISFCGFFAVVLTIIIEVHSYRANAKHLLAAEDLHKRAERAILSIDSFKLSFNPQRFSKHYALLDVNFTVKNSGKTP